VAVTNARNTRFRWVTGDDEGLVKTSYMKRYSGRFTIDDQVKPWLKIGGTLSYNNQSENIVDQGDAVARQIVEDFRSCPLNTMMEPTPTTKISRMRKEP
jgi:hypothetical protein